MGNRSWFGSWAGGQAWFEVGYRVWHYGHFQIIRHVDMWVHTVVLHFYAVGCRCELAFTVMNYQSIFVNINLLYLQ
ncbi:hypothetical protein RchiOBHm_Chr3g0463061 [Rosa chinensis]|uniref:Uncharacterized protein n=1 Tax=Rosa chinensis TaxID=74649 RepID=A0A2P6R928_ROSCH|nr:hypothetical protein RchiOBHm_Chr3g0463061 [Rosa chinensis]